jgi:hypothetical protein
MVKTYIFAIVLLSFKAYGSPQQMAPPDGSQQAPPPPMHGMNMAHMPGHMYMTTLRPPNPSDQRRIEDVVEKARIAMQPFMDYRNALAAGYEINHPNIPQPQYHFTNHRNAVEAQYRFDALKPTSLLYKKTPDGGYKLVGVMYTDRQGASENELNSRVPLSVARWHEHINYCEAPPGQEAAYFGPNARFGLQGSIITRRDCDAAGGRFEEHHYGWMVHIYPFETDPKKMFSLSDDDEGHDNMDRSPTLPMKPMGDMKMD